MLSPAAKEICICSVGFWNGLQCFSLYEEGWDLYQLSISSDGFYAIDPYLQEALKRQINSLSQQTYAVKKKWTVMQQGDEVYMLKVAQNQGVGLGCYVNLKTIWNRSLSCLLGRAAMSVSLTRTEKTSNSDGKRNCKGQFEAWYRQLYLPAGAFTVTVWNPD